MRIPGEKARGFGPFRQTWLSICSAHQVPDESCRLCAIGSWSNDWARAASGLLFRLWPKLWIRLANRK